MAGSISDWLREADFGTILGDLEAYGWFHFVFPFLLVYAVVFTVLNKVEIFDEKKPVKVIIALVFSLFAVAFPISDQSDCGISGSSYNFGTSNGGCTVGDLMISLFPGVTAFSMGILALYIVAAMLGVDLTKFLGSSAKDAWIRYVLGAVGLLVVIYYFALGFGWNGFNGSGFEDFFKDPLLYIIIIFVLFFWYVSKDDDGEDSARERLKKIKEGKEAEGGHH
ncbi:MAG: hypothetical protein KDD45_12800 [Bdellovibrionales bacterium]|nr:hypothetical protein [Bdellovibrionales bacterium]